MNAAARVPKHEAMVDRSRARELAKIAGEAGEPTAWFERLYREAAGNAGAIPWADLAPNPHLVAWARREGLRGDGRAALKVGCGLGDDAEELVRLGFAVTAFDVAETAIDWCKVRFPSSKVDYVVADLLEPPASWSGRFDLVIESYTLQVLPRSVRGVAMARLAELVAPGGTLFIVARARDEDGPEGAMPWPLTARELATFETMGLEKLELEDLVDAETPPVRRFRAVYRRPG